MSTGTSFFGKLKNALSYIARLYNPKNVRDKGVLWTLKLTLVTYVLVIIGLMWYWSREPEFFDVREVALEMAEGDESKVRTPGYVTASTLINIADTLLHKPGGYLFNDVSLPGIVMDNMPSWEFGALTELRETARALRNDFSRAQTQSQEDPDLMKADAQVHFDHKNWILPATEWEYRKGIEALKSYRDRLVTQPAQARFFPRADNLLVYLSVVEKRLGSLAHRLSSNVRELVYVPPTAQQNATVLQDADVATNTDLETVNTDPNQAFSEVTLTTPWMEIDNVFFEARGYVWALLHILKAIDVDFRAILENKRGGRPALQRIIHKLKNAEQTIWSPMIMNNSGFGLMTNHSLIMASYISRANAAIIDLRFLLQQG